MDSILYERKYNLYFERSLAMNLVKKLFILFTFPIWAFPFMLIEVIRTLWEDISNWVDERELQKLLRRIK